MLQLKVLGPVVISRNHTIVTGFRSRKALALLIYLACTQVYYNREILADLFWEDRSTKQSLSNLRTVLAHLHDQLGDCLQVTRGMLGISPDVQYSVDAVELRRELTTLLPLRKQEPLVPSAALQLSQALRLYEGDFLAGFHVHNAPSFEEWTLAEGERLRRMVIDGYQHLVDFHLTQGDYRAGLQSVDRWLALDPLDETGHCQRMRLLAVDGQRGAALAQYATCRHILNNELDVEPAEETTLLYEQIRTGLFEHSKRNNVSFTHNPPPTKVDSMLSTKPFNNLPAPLTMFIGRTTELAQIAARLADPGCRLLTVISPGGMGKTALVIQAAAAATSQFTDGVCYVPLADTITTSEIVPAITGALALPASTLTNTEAQLLNYLQSKELLLVLDNVEYLGVGSGFLTPLLERAPRVKVLATSVEPLHHRAEWLLPLGGLAVDVPHTGPLPVSARDSDDHSQLEHQNSMPDAWSDALQLFALRARQVQPRFNLADADLASIIRICQLVEGMPLGIEMAASWVDSLSCAEIAQELERDMHILTTSLQNVPSRQQSLEAVFAHMWDLLSLTERTVLQNVLQFPAGISRAAVQEMTDVSLGTLAELIHKSLLRRTSAGYYAMHPLLRLYAVRRLDAFIELSDSERE